MRHLILIFALILASSIACSLSASPPEEPTEVVRIVTSTPPPTIETEEPRETEEEDEDDEEQSNSGSNSGTSGGTVCTPRADWTVVYTVVAGDTLASIARRANSTVDALTRGNCLSNPNSISVGQRLRVPQTPAAPPPPTTRPPTATPPQTGPIQSGHVEVSSSISGDAGNILLLRDDTILLTWRDAPSGLSSVSFYLGDFTNVIGQDAYPADGATISWKVPAGLKGATIGAIGRFSNSPQVATSFATTAYSSAPPSGQGCEVAAVSGATVNIYSQPDYNSGLVGPISPDLWVEVLGRSLNGWYGFEFGNLNAGATGLGRLRWLPPDSQLVSRGTC
jgi:LysM repeat protein